MSKLATITKSGRAAFAAALAAKPLHLAWGTATRRGTPIRPPRRALPTPPVWWPK